MDSISVFVLTTLEPYLKPILKSASTGLMSASGEVINNHDQYEVSDSVYSDIYVLMDHKVFNDPNAVSPCERSVTIFSFTHPPDSLTQLILS